MAALETPAASTLQFLMLVGKLKHLKRTGWVKKNVLEPETVAGHMYRMSIMAFLIPDTSKVDRIRVIKMALVHDLAEAVVGDITPHCGVSTSDKYTLEKNALDDMVSYIPEPSIQREIVALWQEYEEQITTEAKMVKDFDKFDMILQAYEYERDQLHIGAGGLQEFFASVDGKLESTEVLQWNDALQQLRGSPSS